MTLQNLIRFLIVYSAAVTAAFAATVYFGLIGRVRGADKAADFNRIRVLRIDITEPDGTPRQFISDRSEFSGRVLPRTRDFSPQPQRFGGNVVPQR
jgi:hypothetical protein